MCFVFCFFFKALWLVKDGKDFVNIILRCDKSMLAGPAYMQTLWTIPASLGRCHVQYVLSLCGEKTLCTVILFPEHDEMGQEGVSRGTVTGCAEQRMLRVTLGPNSMPLEPGINGFQILAFTSASSYSQTHTVPAMQILKGWKLGFSTRKDLIIL